MFLETILYLYCLYYTPHYTYIFCVNKTVHNIKTNNYILTLLLVQVGFIYEFYVIYFNSIS